MRLPFKQQNDNQQALFYALPQPPLPTKNADSGRAQFFQHSSTRSRREGVGGS